MASNPMLHLMTQTLTLERYTGVNAYNEKLYAAGAPVACRHVRRPTRVATPTGEVIVARDTIRCPPDTGLKDGDRVTLPDGRVALLRVVGSAPGSRGQVWSERAVCE